MTIKVARAAGMSTHSSITTVDDTPVVAGPVNDGAYEEEEGFERVAAERGAKGFPGHHCRR